jgi:hypothetical protein
MTLMSLRTLMDALKRTPLKPPGYTITPHEWGWFLVQALSPAIAGARPLSAAPGSRGVGG